MDQLQSIIEKRKIDSVSLCIDELLQTYKARDIISFLVNLFCIKYVSQNLDTLNELISLLKLYETQKNCRQELIVQIGTLLATLPAHSPKYPKLTKVPEDLYKLIFSEINEHESLLKYKELLDDHLFRLLCIFRDNITQGTDWKSSLRIVSLFLNVKLPHKLQGGDIILAILLECTTGKEHAYVVSCKDLYYYRSNASIKKIRAGLVYCSTVVATLRNCVHNPAVDPDPYAYLFKVVNIDTDLVQKVAREKASNREKVVNMFLSV
jgi:hypothetical protein